MSLFIGAWLLSGFSVYIISFIYEWYVGITNSFTILEFVGLGIICAFLGPISILIWTSVTFGNKIFIIKGRKK